MDIKVTIRSCKSSCQEISCPPSQVVPPDRLWHHNWSPGPLAAAISGHLLPRLFSLNATNATSCLQAETCIWKKRRLYTQALVIILQKSAFLDHFRQMDHVIPTNPGMQTQLAISLHLHWKNSVSSIIVVLKYSNLMGVKSLTVVHCRYVIYRLPMP